MIALSIVVIGATYILALPALLRLQRLHIGPLIAYASPVLPQVLWWILTAAGVGAQSLTNMIEVVFVGFIVIFASYICAFVKSVNWCGRRVSSNSSSRWTRFSLFSSLLMIRRSAGQGQPDQLFHAGPFFPGFAYALEHFLRIRLFVPKRDQGKNGIPHPVVSGNPAVTDRFQGMLRTS